MTVVKKTDVVDFARRVERLCDFLLDKVSKDGSADVTAVQNLKDDAADLQLDNNEIEILSGLDSHMRGVSE